MLKTKILLIIIKTITTSLNLNRAKNVKSFKHGKYLLGIESGKGKKSRVFFFPGNYFFFVEEKVQANNYRARNHFFLHPVYYPQAYEEDLINIPQLRQIAHPLTSTADMHIAPPFSSSSHVSIVDFSLILYHRTSGLKNVVGSIYDFIYKQESRGWSIFYKNYLTSQILGLFFNSYEFEFF